MRNFYSPHCVFMLYTTLELEGLLPLYIIFRTFGKEMVSEDSTVVCQPLMLVIVLTASCILVVMVTSVPFVPLYRHLVNTST